MTIRFAQSEPDPAIYGEVNEEQEAETIRQQAWDLFVASLRDYLHANRYSFLETMNAVCDAYEGCRHHTAVEIRQFADGYGWPDTLRALAQALEADEQFQREAERRR